MVFIKVTASKFTNLKDKTMRKSETLVTTFIKVIKCSGKTSKKSQLKWAMGYLDGQ